MRLGTVARVLGLWFVFLAGFPAPAEQQEFCIAGIVRNAATGEPMRRAGVTIPEAADLTNAGGGFRFCGLSPGSYYVNAEKPGFAETGIRLTVGPSREDLDLRLEPLSVIRGKVTDGDDQPLEKAAVQLLAAHIVAGRRAVSVAAETVTDDRGEYRIAQVAAGRYYLRAAGWSGDASRDTRVAFVPAYYGGGADLAMASALQIDPGHDLRADFEIKSETGYHISGTVAGLSATPPAKIELLDSEREPIAVSARLDPATGRFGIDSVPQGSYTVRIAQEADPRQRVGELALHVNGDIEQAAVRMSSLPALRGVMRFSDSGADQRKTPPSCSIRLWPAGTWFTESGTLDVATEPDGTFVLESVPPGPYRIHMDCAGAYVAQARMGDADLPPGGEFSVPAGSTVPSMEAVLASDGGTVEVSPEEGAQGPAWVLLLPVSGNELQLRVAQMRKKAKFSGVAPGDYEVYAWTGLPEGFAYADLQSRQSWPAGAEQIHIGARETVAVKVKIVTGELH